MKTESDPLLMQFLQYLDSERNASKHTQSSYMLDIMQFAHFRWGDEALPPFRWEETDTFFARKFVVEFQKKGYAPTTTSRKMSSLRTLSTTSIKASITVLPVTIIFSSPTPSANKFCRQRSVGAKW